MTSTPHATNSAGAQRGAQIVVALAAVVLLGCWGLASMTGSLAIYAAGWVAGVGGAAATAQLYRMWTAAKPDLQQRTQTMTLGLVGWLIVIGAGMTLFRAASSLFVEADLVSLNWSAWLLPVVALIAALAWGVAWQAGKASHSPALQQHAKQHLATVAAIAIAEAGVVYANMNDGARWADVLAGVLAVGVGMAWSWLRLWKRIGSTSSAPTTQGHIDPELSTQTRAALDAAQAEGTLLAYDRLAIEPSPAGTRITVRLHLDPDQSLASARESARRIERSIETLLPAGTVVALLEPAVGHTATQPPFPTPAPTTAPPPPPDPPQDSTPPDASDPL
ncbi:hypothetical protein OT109_12340 [Phycisphaeraceae bacterium D3-23]